MDSFLAEDISNLTLNLVNDLGNEWYIDVKTELGNTIIRKFGPVEVGTNKVDKNFSFNYMEIFYTENKIISDVDKYINKDNFAITQVIEIDRETFNERLRGLLDEICS